MSVPSHGSAKAEKIVGEGSQKHGMRDKSPLERSENDGKPKWGGKRT